MVPDQSCRLFQIAFYITAHQGAAATSFLPCLPCPDLPTEKSVPKKRDDVPREVTRRGETGDQTHWFIHVLSLSNPEHEALDNFWAPAKCSKTLFELKTKDCPHLDCCCRNLLMSPSSPVSPPSRHPL